MRPDTFSGRDKTLPHLCREPKSEPIFLPGRRNFLLRPGKNSGLTGFLVVRQRDANAAHQRGGNVVQHGGQHGERRQQQNIDYGNDR